MAKTKSYQLHKVKIHHNRWLLWAISYALIVAIAMWGYIKVTDINFESQFQADNEFKSTHTYNDNRLGFGVRYPADWSIEASNNEISFAPLGTNEEGVTISRVALGTEKAVRDGMEIIAEKVITVDGVKGVKLVNDLGNRALETVILAKNGGNLYVIRGSDSLVQQVLLTFRFLK